MEHLESLDFVRKCDNLFITGSSSFWMTSSWFRWTPRSVRAELEIIHAIDGLNY